MQKDLVLVLNCGSSSIKFAILNPQTEKNLFSGLVERLGGEATMRYCYTEKKEKNLGKIDHEIAIKLIIELIRKETPLADRILAVGHRVLHGGEKFTRSVVIDQSVIDAIKECIPLGPLHNPANIAGIEGAKSAFNLPQVAVFDTAFHQTMPDYAYLYPIPYDFYEKYAVRRYGFHGTSHRFITKQVIERLNLPKENNAIIVAHLGNGCSLSAILNSKCVDTSMGITPLEGLMMGTRSGDVDPSIHGYLANKLSCSLEEITEILNKKSGLLGVSGIDSDMRTIEDRYLQHDCRATLALEMFCYRLAKYIASYIVPLQKLDAIAFTGGIGEHSPIIRGKVLNLLSHFGFNVIPEYNENNGKNSNGLITDGAPVALVIPTNEELMIAKDTYDLLNNNI